LLRPLSWAGIGHAVSMLSGAVAPSDEAVESVVPPVGSVVVSAVAVVDTVSGPPVRDSLSRRVAHPAPASAPTAARNARRFTTVGHYSVAR
jgi:hypothetical protein